jgi:hypothetical protein
VANTQATFGFRHIGYTSGGSPDYQLATGVILSTNTTKIYRGDPVIVDPTTGKIKQAAAGATQALAGIFDGCMYTPVGGTPVWSPYWPGAGASVDATAYIINAPNALFMAAALNTSIVTANIGENVDFAIGTGSTVTGFSGATVDQSTLNTTNTLPFRIVAPVTTQGNFGVVGNGSDPSTAYGWCVVTFNNTTFKQLQGLA